MGNMFPVFTSTNKRNAKWEIVQLFSYDPFHPSAQTEMTEYEQTNKT